MQTIYHTFIIWNAQYALPKLGNDIWHHSLTTTLLIHINNGMRFHCCCRMSEELCRTAADSTPFFATKNYNEQTHADACSSVHSGNIFVFQNEVNNCTDSMEEGLVVATTSTQKPYNRIPSESIVTDKIQWKCHDAIWYSLPSAILRNSASIRNICHFYKEINDNIPFRWWQMAWILWKHLRFVMFKTSTESIKMKSKYRCRVPLCIWLCSSTCAHKYPMNRYAIQTTIQVPLSCLNAQLCP